MQIDSPSRFLRDIDASLLHVEDSASGLLGENRRRLPWDEDTNEGFSSNWRTRSNDNFREYEPNKAYTGSRPWGQEYHQLGSRYQNSNRVASQFRADPKPKITERKRPEVTVDPLSARTKQRLLAEGGNFKRLSSAMTNGGRTMPSTRNGNATSLSVGATIEHQRFGVGEIVSLEGKGENAKATVDFRNAGRKQLLLKFAKFKVI